MAAAHLANAQAQAMQDAAKNQGGAFTGFMGMNMAQQGGGINAAQPVPDERAAAGAGSAAERADSAGRERLEVRLRRDSHRQVLPRMRREKARTPARGGLDVFLRRGQHWQILFGMRREAPGRRAGLPLRQVRLAARRSGASAEILPGMRRFVRRE